MSPAKRITLGVGSSNNKLKMCIRDRAYHCKNRLSVLAVCNHRSVTLWLLH